MKYFILPVCVAAALSCLPAWAARPDCCKQKDIVRPGFDESLLEGFEPSKAERQDEARGTVTVRIRDTFRPTMKVIQSETVVAAPVDVMWEVLCDLDAYPRMFDRMARSETTLNAGEWGHNYNEVQYPWPWGKRWVLNVIHNDRPRLVSRFKRLEGTIRELEGRFEVRPAPGGGALLRYGVRMDPGLDFVPAWLLSWATSILVPEILRDFRGEAELRQDRKLISAALR
ncbi:MAG: SRPBCC family protein [Candidatus Sericytochromatia bacterium]|uniref:SRPBCC family protein n=1 Tax=Candidatus Tanganyikabacteria bacterium TaxID=2961651 RepID=A0A938BKB5_9BACT|nr:SRPBCC family protein [Candidatus Tanganyikabacteria bacterium]